ncbi:MAG: phosphotransferase [Armatimonadetes bacterium]|nr:phosphotransferase [Armatimonadota bacterium]
MSAQGPITSRDARNVLRAYDAGDLLFTRPGAGTANAAVIVVTPRGQFFLKRRNPRYCDPGQLAFDHSVIRHLAREGLPVVAAMRTRAGSRWFEYEDDIYELYPLVEGRPHQAGNITQVRSAGQLLGRLHHTTRDLEPDGRKRVGRLHDPAASLAGLNWAREHLLQPGDDESARLLDELIRAARQTGERLPDSVWRNLPACIIHGDYHPANLRFRGDEVCGLFDFDWVARAPRAVDVADGIIFFCSRREGPMVAGDIVSLTQSFTLDPELLGAFGSGYGETVQLTRDELRAMPNLLRARWLFCRVDAMQRKVPGKHKLAYLLNGVLGPLSEVDANQDLLTGGDWLTPS